MKTAVCILNYNDAASAINLAERVRVFKNVDSVIIVDNASTDGSELVLSEYARGIDEGPAKVLFKVNPRNGGYGYGNNSGVRISKEEGCECTLIANPDTRFTEEVLDKLIAAASGENVAVAGAIMEGKPLTDCAWPLLSFKEEAYFAGPVLKRVHKKTVLYPESLFDDLPQKVGAVHGSLLLVRNEDFLKAGGFDEDFFLFCEEKVLGQKMSMIGKDVVLTDAVYSHAGSETMKKAGLSAVGRQKERQKSERLYMEKYLHATKPQMFSFRLLQGFVLIETFFASVFRLI